MASDNNYIRGDGTCGAHYSLNGGQSWNDSTVPNGFTRGFGSPREYWQGGGDWDTRGNAYLSCQLFNRGTAASPNPDQSSAFVLYRSTQNNGASWNFPGRYSTSFFDPGQDRRGLQQQDPGERVPRRGRHVQRHVHRSAPPDPGDAVGSPGGDRPVLAVECLHPIGHAGGGLLRPSVRRRRDHRLVGSLPVGEPGHGRLRPDPGDLELDARPDPVRGPKGGRFYGDYTGLAALDKAHPLWSDTRSRDLFVCPGTATPGNPPALCGATEPNGQQANDQDIFTSTLGVPTGQNDNGGDGGQGGGGNAHRKRR
ncbi:MAG: hypothetical protein M3022_01490 [Actinomycetota bacterium]|nr:hypothetical protein [Actinomycetota bacterium]